MKFTNKILALLVVTLLASLAGAAMPVQAQETTTQDRLVVFESVGSDT